MVLRPHHLAPAGVSLLFATLLFGTPASDARTDCRLAWRTVGSPAPQGLLQDVSVTKSGEAWAVGADSHDRRRTLIEHWDGTRWEVVSSPNGPGDANTLQAAVARAPNDVWAVGNHGTQTSLPAHTLIEHWDGRAWSIVSSPDASSSGNTLDGVAALSRNDVWAVGSRDVGSDWAPLIEHWDGRGWKVVLPKPVLRKGELFTVALLSKRDIWVAGSGARSTLAMHWNGRRWRMVTTPPKPAPNEEISTTFYAVATTARNDLWAAGYVTVESLIAHWDGRRWTRIAHPPLHDVGGGEPALRGLAALSRNDVWAVGDNGSRAIRLHWDGKHWKARRGPGGVSLFGISALSPHYIWAVGDGHIERYSCA
jgi:hypothetical protein